MLILPLCNPILKLLFIYSLFPLSVVPPLALAISPLACLHSKINPQPRLQLTVSVSSRALTDICRPEEDAIPRGDAERY